MNDRLLYGKNESKNVVSIEIDNETATIFTEDESGVKTYTEENRYWILSNEKAQKNWSRLKGESYYKFGKQFTDRKEWEKAKYTLKNRFDLYSIYNQKESFMVLKGLTYFKGMIPSQVSILSFDIETTSINLDDSAKLLLISNTFRKNGVITKKLFAFDDYNDVGEMISTWCKWVCEMNPSIMIGHNVNGFDLNYISFIAKQFNVELKLGRNGSAMTTSTYESKFRKDGSQSLSFYKSHIYGREIVDTMFLSIKYDVVAKKYPSYGLKPIIKAEGLEKASRTFYDASKIRFNYKDPVEWAKIKVYCEDDSDDALALFDLMIPAQFYLANSIPKPFQLITESATGSQLNSFLIRSYLQEGHSIPKASELTPVKGGISFGIPGIYSNVIKIDLKSAYPSQVLRFKLFDPIKDPEGNFYKMVHHFTYERFDLKKKFKETGDKYYSDREQAGKIVINSAYGLMNTNGLNFNNSDIASKITLETRNMIELSLKWASGKDMEFYKQYMKEEVEENEQD